MSFVQKYRLLETFRIILKATQRLSYQISAFDKKFPLEEIENNQEKEYMLTYLSYCSQYIELFESFKKFVLQEKTKIIEIVGEESFDQVVKTIKKSKT